MAIVPCGVIVMVGVVAPCNVVVTVIALCGAAVAITVVMGIVVGLRGRGQQCVCQQGGW
jgi:hypothetical protein